MIRVFIAAGALLLATTGWAAEAPSNAELYDIIQAQQAELDRLADNTSDSRTHVGGYGELHWQQGTRSAWILEEIGKEEPITAGFVVDNGLLHNVQILIYRESRGWEVRYPFFTDQFHGAQLDDTRQLNQPIDNISGATLSVGAITRMARLALYYAGLVNPPPDSDPYP